LGRGIRCNRRAVTVANFRPTHSFDPTTGLSGARCVCWGKQLYLSIYRCFRRGKMRIGARGTEERVGEEMGGGFSDAADLPVGVK
jgi:hypothetical protein